MPRGELNRPRGSGGAFNGFNGLVGSIPGQVESSLEVDPELRGGAKGLGKEPGGIRRDSPLPADQLVDPLDGNSQIGGQGNLRDAQGMQVVIS